MALPVILKVLNAASSDADEGDKHSLDDLFRAAYSIGTSIQRICEELVNILLHYLYILAHSFVDLYLQSDFCENYHLNPHRKEEGSRSFVLYLVYML